MGPLRTLKILRRAQKLFGLLQQGTDSYNKAGNVSKSLFGSKTFWFNVITLTVELTQALPVPPGAVATVVAVGNVLLRLVTNKAIGSVLPK